MSSALVFVALLVALRGRCALCLPVETPHADAILSKVAAMRSYMKADVDPCENFYEYACGNWPKLYPADPAVNLTTGVFEIMNNAYQSQLKDMLKGGPEAADTATDTKVKDFHQSCISFVEHVAADEYRKQLREVIAEFGAMPALSGDTWDADKFDWLETVARIAHKYGKRLVAEVEALPDFRDNSVNILFVDTPDFPLQSRSMYLSEDLADVRQLYRKHIANELQTYLGMDEDIARRTAGEIVEFEVALARGMIDDKTSLSLAALTQETTAAAMTQKYAPILDVEKLINIALGETVTGPILEYAESYQKNLVAVLGATPKRVVANHIMYSLLGDFLLNTTVAPEDREALCLARTKKYFAKNLDNMVHRRYSNAGTGRDVTVMFEELRDAFAAELESDDLEWIAAETRQRALEKLQAMELELNTYENEDFEEEFGQLQISKDNFIGNLKSVLELNGRRYRTKLHRPPVPMGDAETLSYTPANIVTENKIKVPVMVLQPNTLWMDFYPNALKFGTLGMVMGHELIHGFDDSGRNFDKSGNAANWWDAASTDTFRQRTDCFVDQYSRYSYGGKLMPRSPLQAENIADNGGLKLAYKAYLRWLKKTTESGGDVQREVLPTMNYTSKQLVFVAFAQLWCNDAHPSVFARQTAGDTHVPSTLRVIGSLSNFPEFAKEFGCGQEAPMRPSRRCEIY